MTPGRGGDIVSVKEKDTPMTPYVQSNSHHVRSMSFAPESIRPWLRTEAAPVARPLWILCRNFDQRPIADDDALLRLTEQGRVQPGDYLVNTGFDRCVQARDVVELDAIFRTSMSRRLETGARALAAAALALMSIAPLLGSLLFLTAIATALVSTARMSPRRAGGMA